MAAEDPSGALPPGVTVRGGVGGTRARTEELGQVAHVLRVAAEALEEAAGHVARLTDVVESAAGYAPGTAPAARASLLPLGQVRGGAVDRAAAVRGLAEAVDAAARAYVRAEQDVLGSVHGVLVRGAAAWGELGPLAWLGPAAGLRLAAPHLALGAAVAALTGRRPSPAQVERTLELGAAFALGAAPGRLPAGDRAVPRLASVVDRLLTARRRLTGDGRDLLVAPVVTGARPDLLPTTAPADLGAVLRHTEALSPVAGGVAGAVAVQRLDHGDGRRTWVVAVPGTQSAGLGQGRNPLDMQSNLRLVGSTPSDSSAVVARAMVQAGVRRDERVLLVGHSQGGMAAMEVAGDPLLAGRFDVAAVVTAGSPVAHLDVPAHVQTLHLEHLQDYVPAADGAPNPDLPHRTTVQVDLGASSSAQDRAAALSPVGAHEVGRYARSVELLEGVVDPSLSRHALAVEEVLGDGTAATTTRVFAGERLDPAPTSAPSARFDLRTATPSAVAPTGGGGGGVW